MSLHGSKYGQSGVGSPTTLLFLLGLLLPPVVAEGQVVVGRALDATSGEGLPVAFVELVDEEGVRRASGLTDPHGAFRFLAPAPGLYRLRVERIGYQAYDSEPFDVGVSAPAELTAHVQPRAVELEGIEVTGEARCTVRPDAEGGATARLWDEARKGLTVSAWAQKGSVLEYRVVRWRRTLHPRRLTVESEQRQRGGGFTGRSPFVSLPAEELHRDGYVQEDGGAYDYYAPDAEVLLSDAFLDSHCFHVRRDDPPAEGRIGLAFEPLSDRDVADVSGVLWLDEASAELDRLDFEYTRLPAGLESDEIGGTIEFDQVPDGPWIVHRWTLRIPVVSMQRVRTRRGLRRGSELRPVLDRIIETGGEVVEVRTPAGSPLLRPTGAVLVGAVRDTVADEPEAGVRVGLSGLDVTGRSDATGRFRLQNIPDGRYEIVLPLVGGRRVETGVTVTLEAGDTVSVTVPWPPVHLSEPAEAVCPEPSAPGEDGIIEGVVRIPSGGTPPAGAEVVARWERPEVSPDVVDVDRYEVRAPVGPEGAFRLCELPARKEIEVTLEVGRRTLGAAPTLMLTEGARRFLLLEMEEPGG